MKQFTTILLSGLFALLFTACGGGGSSTPVDTPTDGVTVGSGTIDDPYIVGNGTYDSAEGIYFKINMELGSSSSCGLIVFNKLYAGYLYQAEVFDNTYSLVDGDSQYGWDIDTSGDYLIKADTNSYASDEKIHIYSNCITNGTMDIDTINIGLNNFIGEETHLYKIVLAQDSKLDVNGIDNIFGITYYNSNFIDLSPHSNIGITAKSMNLQAGTYYILIESSLSDTQTSFNVVVTPN